MVRVNRGLASRKRHKKILKLAKGYRGNRSKLFCAAKNAVAKAGMRSYVHRKLRRREFRAIWITRINAALKPYGINYSRFINAMATKKVIIDRKILAELAVSKPEVFGKIVGVVK
ncbi:MAG: 50S ribosomal protein L20, large subunit ribosomal protein L20 [Candidatus Peregrinibacteria bacterium GW2011_GWF2_43_17]|nr:MAG: 50S ribosomal protein L20, large subunit ribosomal protein L20 [Candidatus Peregrinibacteria bacterium GW2011_GWF2_43_17]KKT19210.1 MAG: 50S ribosomal protein L20 [Candidatus Peregrinibacteria bacterium GW2011_GWA2_43_8]HAU39617.1 50S ribosomal protein L20 [Candidatus Peregrinibacteria bacterium]